MKEKKNGRTGLHLKKLLCKRYCQENKKKTKTWRKYLQDIWDKFKIYNEFLKFSKKTNNLILKWAKDLNAH